ncbi:MULTISPECIES: DUF2878 domain-containing protein [unclassified Luteibacter]|uniref:DUF2878 domain-containing protein n=1 Tax=unclassified Luteibacter TaxID=2620188 RepID=UPI00163B0B41|nr:MULTISPECIES: DUF2878 domain-containing protein [unclassified Luteibacter]
MLRSPIVTFIVYEALWFAVVIAAGGEHGWMASGFTVAFVAWQVAMARERRLMLRLACLAVVFGAVVDGGATALGFVRYAADVPAPWPGGPPCWILGLWAAFAVTMPGPMRWLAGRPWPAALLGAIGGPLSYAGAARGWHTVLLTAPSWHGYTWLAVTWALAMAALAIALERLGSGGAASIEG